MSKQLDELLNSNTSGGIRDYEQIADIISNLLDNKASYILNSVDPHKKGPFKVILDDCHLIPLCREHILFKELLSLLFNADLFVDLGTPAEDGATDFFTYPQFLTYNLLCNLFFADKYVPEVTQFLNINFYKFSQHMTNLISKADSKHGAHICGHLMHQLQVVNDKIPDNDDTVRDIINMLRQNFRPWYPGTEDIDIYQERIMALCLAAWDMLIVYPCEAYGLKNRTNVYKVLQKFGDQDFYSEFNEYLENNPVGLFACEVMDDE